MISIRDTLMLELFKHILDARVKSGVPLSASIIESSLEQAGLLADKVIKSREVKPDPTPERGGI